MVEWALTDSGSACPDWTLKNKIFISQVVLAFVSDFEPLLIEADQIYVFSQNASIWYLRAIQGEQAAFLQHRKVIEYPKSKVRNGGVSTPLTLHQVTMIS